MMNTRTKLILSLHAALWALSVVAVAQAGEPADEAYRRAVALDSRGQLDEARFYYGKALLHKPDDRRALLRLGLLENRMGDTESAQVVLDRLQKMCATCTETQRLEQVLSPRVVGRAM
jgi:Flp pilus assembly protein TadD